MMTLKLSRICKCDICDSEVLTKQEQLPQGWVLLWEYSTVLCDICLDKYISKFGGEPEYYAKGAEKDIELPFYVL